MPRRPRPAYRRPPLVQPMPTRVVSFPETSLKDDRDFKPVAERSEVQNLSNSGTGQEEDAGSDHEYFNTLRVAQWSGEKELEMESSDDEASDEEQNPKQYDGPSTLKSLRKDLSSLPLGTLRKARRALTPDKSDSDSEINRSAESHALREPDYSPGPKGNTAEMRETPAWRKNPKPDIAKRSNKHAPVEVTSKMPVTRRRTIVDVTTAEPRDPRFLPMVGEFSAQKFRAQYGFLADAHEKELTVLRENLKRARKLLFSSPRDVRARWEREVNSLEVAVKRAESLVNMDRREKMEQEVVGKVTQEEREKRKWGKREWWMKESDKRELLVRARYEALASHGGDRAVKKAIEKKRKKISGKEKKSTPFVGGRLEGERRGKLSLDTNPNGREGRFVKRRKMG